MEILILMFVFIFGTIIGSFLNVVIYRLNTSLRISKGRSICFSCNKKLYWYELIPVLSFLAQKGRCRGCASRISHQYPIVEIVTGIIFVFLAYHFLPIILISAVSYIFALSFFTFIFALLIVITFYDLRHKIIPDRLVYSFIFLSFVSMFLNFSGVGELLVLPNLWQILSGPIIALPFALLWYFSKGRLIGFGDIKLMLGLGWMLGLLVGLSALFIAFWVGAVVGLFMIALKKARVSMKTEVPFAPFLVLGILIAFLLNLNVFTLSTIFIF